ncbi:MAG TPA: SCO family protein [Terriglobales bacterium]|nr:SCO family protein [Terriglobales bacterium]
MKFVVMTRMKQVLATAVLVCVIAGLAQAQGGMMGGGDLPSTALPPNLGNVTINQNLNNQLPLDVPFRDESGRTVTLREFFKPGRPVLLSLVYYDCPMLCTEVLNGMTGMLRVLKFDPGKEFQVVTVSFDSREKPELAAAKKKAYLQRYGRAGAAEGWRFLTGDQSSVDALTNAAGFRYQWDEKLQQFAHAAAIMVATPEGKLSHYFYGVEYSPKDVRLALVEASNGKIGNPVDQVLLYCYHYDPRTGKYGAVISNVVRIAGAITILVLGSFLFIMFRREPKSGKKKKVEKGDVVSSR